MSKLWAFLSNFGFFTIAAHQIWSCYLTQEANFENFLFCPNSTFNIRKSHKISCGKAHYFRSYQPKTSRGGGGENTPPSVPLGLTNELNRVSQPISIEYKMLDIFNQAVYKT